MMPGNASADEAQEAWGKGNAACLRGDFDLAVRYYTEAIRLNPKDAATYNNRGYAYLQKGDSDKAIADYDEAIRLDPKYAKAHFFRGSGYEDKGDQDKAVADYTAAIRLDPKYARAYCDRGPAAKEPAIADDEPHATRAKSHGHASTGVTFFVAPNGNDRNPGTIERPFATLYKAHQWVRPGDTVNLRAGTYQALISWTKSGTPTAPITIQAYNGEDVTLQSSEQYALDAGHRSDLRRLLEGRDTEPADPISRVAAHGLGGCRQCRRESPPSQIWAIVKGGYMCAPMNAAADFARPQAAAGLPLTDKQRQPGRMTSRGTTESTKTLWFKPGPSRVTDPSRQLYVTSTSSGQFSLAGSYLKLNGLKFKYLYYFHQQDNPTGCDINNCEIKHAGRRNRRRRHALHVHVAVHRQDRGLADVEKWRI